MMELAYFYGWTLTYIRSLTIHELDIARDYMISQNDQGGTGGSKRHKKA